VLAVLAAVGLIIGVAAPASAGGKGKLKVATSLPAPGFWNGDTPAQLDGGYEWGIAKEIAKRLGYDGYSVKNVSFDALVAGKAKGFDLALSQVTITKDRAKVVGFTTPYFDSDQGILVQTGTKVDESNLKDIQWGVQGTTTGQTYLNKVVKPTKKPRSYTETTQAFAALQAGQIDAVLLDTSIVLQQAAASDGKFEVVGQLKSGEHYGGITAKGSKLLKSFNKTIKALKADGTLSDLADEFLTAEFGKDPQRERGSSSRRRWCSRAPEGAR
jgi:polar amino acid transport system substrate-binding protein